jgi:hypothetical protein
MRMRHPHPRAAAVHPISDLQIEYSVLSRGIEDGILDTCRELGIGITAYGVLSRGVIGALKHDYELGDHRATWPRFQGDNLDRKGVAGAAGRGRPSGHAHRRRPRRHRSCTTCRCRRGFAVPRGVYGWAGQRKARLIKQIVAGADKPAG